MFPHFPYTNFHALNLDWVIAKIRLAIMSINGNTPDENGNVTITPEDVNAVATVNGIAPDANGNVNVGTVKSVNNLSPTANGNVNVGTVKSVNNTLPDSAGNVNLQTVAGVTSVGGVGPDSEGNVPISVNHQTPSGTGNITLRPANIDPHNVKYYGAVGDGVTDDTTAFQNALNTIKDIIVPEGTYIISSLTLPTEAAIMGLGNKSKLKVSGTISTTNWYTILSNLFVIADKTQGATSYIIDSTAPYTKIENLTIQGNGYGINYSGENSIILNSIIEVESNAINAPQSTRRIKIVNSTFRGPAVVPYTGTALKIANDSSEIIFDNCFITNFDTAIEMGNNSNRVQLISCITNDINIAVKMLGTVFATTIENCVLYCNTYAIYVDLSFDGIIISNSFIYTQNYGIYAHSSNGSSIQNGIITNCAILSPTVFTNGVNTYCDNFLFESCVFGKYAGQTAPTTGYVFDGADTNCSNFMIAGSSFVGRSQVVPTPHANKTFVNNLGYTP